MRSSQTHTATSMSADNNRASVAASKRSDFTRAWLIARTSWALATTTRATCRRRIRATANAGPVASSTT